MRPIKLTMQAFGPYAGKQELPMSDLGESGIYAITGETGAGKTTIFDAIVYALYGIGSGQDREDPSRLRCAAADPETETFVELTFVAGGKQYTISRRPAQRLRGNSTDTPAKQVLTMPAGEAGPVAITKAREISQKIEEDIIGLTVEQFTQCVMIAQGEFRKLLRANTDERTKILRRVFKTDRYDRLAMLLRDLSKQKDDELNNTRRTIATLISVMEADAASTLREKLAEAQGADPRTLYIDELLQLADDLTAEDEALYTGAEATARKTAGDALSAKAAYDNAMQLQQNRSRLATLQADMAVLKTGLASAKEAMAEAEAHRPEIAALKEEAARLEAKLADYDSVVKLQQERTTALRSKAKAGQDAHAFEEQKAAKQQRDASLCEEAERLSDAAERRLKASQQQNDLKAEADKLAALADRKARQRDAQSKLKKAVELRQRAEEDAKAAAALEAALQKEYDGLGETKAGLEQLRARAAELKKEGDELDAVCARLEACRQADEAYAAAAAEYQAKALHAAALEAEAIRLRNAYDDDIAGVLAQTLTEGVPCRVCGSTHHPNPARLTGSAPTKAAVQQARNAADGALEEKSKANAAAASAKARADELQKQMADLLPGIPPQERQAELASRRAAHAEAMQQVLTDGKKARAADDRKNQLAEKDLPAAKAAAELAGGRMTEATAGLAAAESALTSAGAELNRVAEGMAPDLLQDEALAAAVQVNRNAQAAAQQAIRQAERDQTRLTAIAEERKLIAGEMKKLDTDLSGAAQLISALEASIREKDAQLAALLQKLPYESEQLCRNAISDRRTRAAALDGAITDAQSRVTSLTAAEAGKQGEINALAEQLKGQPEADAAALKADWDAKQLLASDAARTEKLIFSRKSKNAQQQKALHLQADAAAVLEGEARMIGSLSRVANGNVPGKAKVTLEAYVQAAYFDRIIDFANARLVHMSREQYSLERRETADAAQRGKTGLDLDVVDHYNGTSRAVSTLSGGESFLASLSLALGMSDAIQAAAASAVQLDCMFVDEGFGSLSERYLDLVMDELNETASVGKRLIGIISHIDEVKDSIANRIEVTKERDVSKARIVSN